MNGDRFRPVTGGPVTDRYGEPVINRHRCIPTFACISYVPVDDSRLVLPINLVINPMCFYTV